MALSLRGDVLPSPAYESLTSFPNPSSQGYPCVTWFPVLPASHGGLSMVRTTTQTECRGFTISWLLGCIDLELMHRTCIVMSERTPKITPVDRVEAPVREQLRVV